MDMKTFAAALLVLGAAAAPSAHALDVPSAVVDAAWVNAHKGELTILQVSGPLKAFTTAPEIKTEKGKLMVLRVSGHVPGAHFVDFKTVRVDRTIAGKKVKGLIPPKQEFEKLVRSWGVNNNAALVIVPAGRNTGDVGAATRLYWQLKYYGHNNMAILDGGMAAWLAAGLPAATDAPTHGAGDWTARGEDKSILATYREVKSDLGRKGMQFVDARPQNQYMGVFTKPGELSGHLPGARDFSPDLVTTAGGNGARFLPAASYRSLMKAKHINPAAATVTYCNTGHLASGVWFVAHEIVGNKRARLYDGSMVEYSALGGKTVNPARLN